ncbi:hypothetical protein L227DRAFT_575750 [Lentinus tigrinus ALCF2SS1-6]|uniref:CBD9-like protein n=1 Tax=Lentinus tigrinus ALCF2SS1-6 TaxID=1328759 RepID=A0A5C2S7B2_9APHY|nr:hypothetical protein L227DRAFT_575750 [Lentinus tigrinus ALCF2SS1-6]
MRSGLGLFLLGLASLVAAKDGRGRGDDDSYYGGGGDGDASGTSSAAASSPSATGAAASDATNSTSGLTGGSKCVGSYMCISGVINGSTVQYTMQSNGKANLGWMALGFGTQMANTPMVIMWPNSDGKITLSQRKAPGEVMPTVDSSPARVASADAAASDLSGTQPKLTFTIPSDGTTKPKLIWAFGTTNPNSNAVDASLEQHIESAATTLDLSQPISSGNSTADPVSDPNAAGGSDSTPLLPFQKMIVAHALLCTIGFLILLPAGALLARYARTFTSGWFQGHWIFQFAIAAPVIISGVAVGIAAVSSAGAMHLDDDHKRWGVAIFVIYFIQCAVGAIIHWIKPTSWTVRKKRPAQNYFHAILGIIVIGLAFFQVRNGYNEEWTSVSGRPPISNAANIVWYVWVVLVPVLYLAGLAFLPKQLRQERPTPKAPSEEYSLRPSYADEPRYSDRG